MFTLLHTESSKGWGGQENRTLRESLGLKKYGVKTIFLCQPGSELSKRASAAGFEIRECRMEKSYDITAFIKVLRTIKTDKIDIVNTHSGRDSLIAGIAGRLSSRSPKIVRTRHLEMPITSRFTYSLLPHKVVTVSDHVKRYLISKGVNPEDVISVPTGIDTAMFDPDRTEGTLKKELGLSDSTPLVGTVAILRRKKGHHILLDAVPTVLKNMPDARFVFAGDGPQNENLKAKINELGIGDRVLMLGMRRDMPNILKSIDVFVLPTLQEALGTSFIEAMAMGKPVIGSNVGGVGEVVRDSVNGYLVPPEDPAALAEAVLKMLGDKQKAGRMGLEGRQIAEQEFTTEKMCEKMYGLYMELLGRNGS
ncbi:MAG: glycosyltransferase family 1 protein [Nitrospirae bacterium]|nr:MAG: glycosyltransferase family 1 protein [Nitrospirota bacterium]